jgi:rod shape-determining protein MreB
MIFKKLKAFFTSTVYVQLREDRIKITNIETKEIYDQVPYIAIDASNPKQRVIRAIGAEAYNLRLDNKLEVSNPFSHPRLLIADFMKAEKVLMQGIREVHTSKFLAPRPVVIIHPMDKLEGGVTDIECKVYKELALGAGAREVHIHVGKEIDPSVFNLNDVCAPEII